MVLAWEMGKSRGSKMASLVSGTVIELPGYHYLRGSIELSKSGYHYLNQVQEEMKVLDALPPIELFSI